MTVLYVREQGAVVRRDVEQIRVTLREKSTRRMRQLEAISVRELEQLVLYGNVQLTSQAGALLLRHGIDAVFLTLYGKYLGRLSRDGSRQARLRHQQLRFADDAGKSLNLARTIVRAKLANQAHVLRGLAGTLHGTQASHLTDSARKIEELARTCNRAHGADALRGYEGRAGALYFGCISRIMPAAWRFNGRNYHPPLDPLNAMLSFGYALLLKDVSTAINLVGLDPYIGCFHSFEYGRPSLSLDLMEEFRPAAVDQYVYTMALNGAIKPENFVFTQRPERPVELGTELMPLMIKAYESAMSSVYYYPAGQSRQTLRRIVELQTRIYARTIMETRSGYAAFRISSDGAPAAQSKQGREQ